jgi:hypothetical protein
MEFNIGEFYEKMCSYCNLHQNLARTACALYDDRATCNSASNTAQIAKYLPEQKLCRESKAPKNDTHAHTHKVSNNIGSKDTHKHPRFMFLYSNFRYISVLRSVSGNS